MHKQSRNPDGSVCYEFVTEYVRDDQRGGGSSVSQPAVTSRAAREMSAGLILTWGHASRDAHVSGTDGELVCPEFRSADHPVKLHRPHCQLDVNKLIEPGSEVDETGRWVFALSLTCLQRSEQSRPLDLSVAGVSQVATRTPHVFSTPLPGAVLYSRPFDRFEPIMTRYNEEFSKIPLTSHLRVNPFSYRSELSPTPGYLYHAVMALAGHHVQSDTAEHHHLAALQLLRERLEIFSSIDGHVMIDSIVMLFSLGETKSALGNWRTHLLGAYGILEVCGGIDAWMVCQRTRVQVAMLIWWDAITSLVSREACVFPCFYVEALLATHDKDDGDWSFYDLCGCPTSLVHVVIQLTRFYGAAPDTDTLTQCEEALVAWQHDFPPSSRIDERCEQHCRDAMHCAEAWRHGLLLYIYRVHQWELGTAVSPYILGHAQMVVDHVSACEQGRMVARQALLPLIFAGCELDNITVRERILHFCESWDQRTRYHMFQSAVPLLQRVWTEQEAKGAENVWWGAVVDDICLRSSDSPMQERLCFG